MVPEDGAGWTPCSAVWSSESRQSQPVPSPCEDGQASSCCPLGPLPTRAHRQPGNPSPTWQQNQAGRTGGTTEARSAAAPP